MPFYKQIKQHAQPILAQLFQLAPTQKGDFAVKVPADPSPEFIANLSNLKRTVLFSVFQPAFTAQANGAESPVVSVTFSQNEAFYVKAAPDRICVSFSTDFQDESDRIFGKLFLQVNSFLSLYFGQLTLGRNSWMQDVYRIFKQPRKSYSRGILQSN